MSQSIQELAHEGYSVRASCQAFGLPRARYYRGLSLPEPTDTNVALREHIQRVALDCSCYGYRRVTKALHRQGVASARSYRQP